MIKLTAQQEGKNVRYTPMCAIIKVHAGVPEKVMRVLPVREAEIQAIKNFQEGFKNILMSFGVLCHN